MLHLGRNLLFHSVKSQDKDYFHWTVPPKHWLLRIWFYLPAIQWKCLSSKCSFFCHRAREPWALLPFLMLPLEGRAWPLMTIALPTSNVSRNSSSELVSLENFLQDYYILFYSSIFWNLMKTYKQLKVMHWMGDAPPYIGRHIKLWVSELRGSVFNSRWTKKFQTLKLGLEKAEESEIKLQTSVGS